MASRPRCKMPVSERAKQFSPFSALTGLEEILAREEKIYQQKRELSDERAAEINTILCGINRGDSVEVTYYSGGEYVTSAGEVLYLDAVSRTLRLDGERIAIDDIYSISVNADKQESDE